MPTTRWSNCVDDWWTSDRDNGPTVKTLTTIEQIRSVTDAARRGDAIVGLVPTMGYLHRGHVSLMLRARDECDVVVASIFVNPLQFGEGEDLDSYPRDIDGDSSQAASAGVDALFVPDVAEMYPSDVLTTVSVASVGSSMEGASRPTHFDGVATVVAKLLSIVGPCRAYFGEKDYQQLAVIRRMQADLSIPVEVIGCPTVREDDGLALSSRNVRLTASERAEAPVLRRALTAGADLIMGGEADARAVRSAMADVVNGAPLAQLDYVEVADPDSLDPLTSCDEGARLFGAIRYPTARLIDNRPVIETT